eukprot:gene12032-biopygen21442
MAREDVQVFQGQQQQRRRSKTRGREGRGARFLPRAQSSGDFCSPRCGKATRSGTDGHSEPLRICSLRIAEKMGGGGGVLRPVCARVSPCHVPPPARAFSLLLVANDEMPSRFQIKEIGGAAAEDTLPPPLPPAHFAAPKS